VAGRAHEGEDDAQHDAQELRQRRDLQRDPGAVPDLFVEQEPADGVEVEL
jgi:hypothetical protein